jgi:2'-hydroxyisoflavone reductase
VGRYVFISSLSVYSDLKEIGLDESDPVGKLEDESVEEITGETYGPLKALCEKTVQDTFGAEHALIIRPGLIVGPHDPTDRFTYWPVRVARGGEVLAPGDPATPVQFIDARDLAGFIVRLVEDGHTGIYNAVGPKGVLTMQELLHGCKVVLGADARFTWVSDAFLAEQEVGAWMELPLWLPASEGAGLGAVSHARALAHGLTFRPAGDTIRDTQAWHGTRSGPTFKVQLKPDKEAAILRAWHAKGTAKSEKKG